MDRPCIDANVICIAVVVGGDECGGRFVGLVCGFISSAADSHIRRGYMKIVKRKGESKSPSRVPLSMEIGAVLPWMVI